MGDRRKLTEEINKANALYEQFKDKVTETERIKMRKMLANKKARLINEYGDDLQKLDLGNPIAVKGGTVSEKAEDLLGSGSDIAKKEARLSKLMNKTAIKGAKKAAGVIPLAGVGMAALSGDPAQAAEELVEDAMGPLAALKPDVAGSAEDDREIIAERKAIKNYKNSPAAKAAKLNKLRSLMGK